VDSPLSATVDCKNDAGTKSIKLESQATSRHCKAGRIGLCTLWVTKTPTQSFHRDLDKR